MKPLTKEQLTGLIHLVGATHEHELDCSECLAQAAEFAERELAGLPRDEALVRVEQHLEVCPECREELLALMKILQAQD